MHSRLYVSVLFIFISSVTRAFQIFNGVNVLPPEISKQLDDYWQTYKMQFNKTYTRNQENARRMAWEQNLVEIYKHNLMAAAGHHSYTLRDNHITDLSSSQYMRKMVKLIPSRKRRLSTDSMLSAILRHDIPARLDWRELGFNTPPVNQRECGSCYAYSVVESIQGQIFKQTGMLIPLSAQQLVDCSSATGNRGCSGGSLRNTLRYLERSKGLMARSLYPYQAQEGQCKFHRDLSVVNITSWAILPARDEEALEAAVASVGPIAVSINAMPKTFQLYQRLRRPPVQLGRGEPRNADCRIHADRMDSEELVGRELGRERLHATGEK
ncbi:cathepsin 8-like isoform X2 [Odontomachus brunneus]|uniref:cathepsin 8-like isoform X2 n=1 Tax=Odontomachus brunneus TaxID=486640 RepID=UPI0013F287A0|nr:cathepsin 8-like isoform X2 [Odontomachus brunneus]